MYDIILLGVRIGFLINSTRIGENSPPIDICFRISEGNLQRNIIINVTSSSVQAVKGTYIDME